jgi:hypothetical protein
VVLEEKGKKLQRGQRGLECADGSGGPGGSRDEDGEAQRGLVGPGVRAEGPEGGSECWWRGSGVPGGIRVRAEGPRGTDGGLEAWTKGLRVEGLEARTLLRYCICSCSPLLKYPRDPKPWRQSLGTPSR